MKFIVQESKIKVVGGRLHSRGLTKITLRDNRDGTWQMEFPSAFANESDTALVPILNEVHLLSQEELVRICPE
jgi:hypothetical protein